MIFNLYNLLYILFFFLITTLHILALGFGAYVSTVAREIPQEFQESKWIAMAMGSPFQIFLIGVPTIVAVYTLSSFGRFICMSLIVFVTKIPQEHLQNTNLQLKNLQEMKLLFIMPRLLQVET